MLIASTAANVTQRPRVSICLSPVLQPLSPTGPVYPYVNRQHCSHCQPLATCIHIFNASTADSVTHWPRVSICVSPVLQPLSPTGHVYPYVYRQYCSHCHPLATCFHMLIDSTAATVTHWQRVSICLSPTLQTLSPLATCILMRITSTAATVTPWPRVSICESAALQPLSTHWPRVSIRVSAALQPLSPTGHVYPYMYRQHCSHCHPTGHVYPYVYWQHCSQCHPTGHVYPYVYLQHCSHCHPLTTCIHMCICSTAATVTHRPRGSICESAALQPLSPTGHVYPYLYRQHCSHCHLLTTCIHMCFGSTAATVTHRPRVSICVSAALQPLSPTGHVYPYVYRHHCSHCHPMATCINMCIASNAATDTH